MNWNALFRNLLMSLIFCTCVFKGMAQHNHFIYIQSSDKKPFYVSLNNRNFSSSADGYLIIPKLTDGEYQLQLGFTDGQQPEQKFTIKVVNRDDGYSLKNLGDKGWGLSNLKTKETILSSTAPVTSEITSNDTPKQNVPAIETEKQLTFSSSPSSSGSNLFGEMLSQVVNDPDLTKEVNIKKTKKDKKINKPDDTIIADNSNDNTISVVDSTPIGQDTTKPVQTNENPYDSYNAARTKGVIKVSEKYSDGGTDLVFIDFNSTSQDTVHLFIPTGNEIKKDSSGSNEAIVTKTDSVPATANVVKIDTPKSFYQPYTPNEKPFLQFPPKTDTVAVVKTEEKKDIANPFFNKSDTGKQDTGNNTSVLKTDSNPASSPQANTVTPIKRDCKKMVSEEELNKWKKKMISANSDGEMIKVVNKLMPGKCLTTEQVKSLSGLFLSDEGRYSFFDAAYSFTYDAENYSALENQLFDSYYKKRFKAILH